MALQIDHRLIDEDFLLCVFPVFYLHLDHFIWTLHTVTIFVSIRQLHNRCGARIMRCFDDILFIMHHTITIYIIHITFDLNVLIRVHRKVL